MTPAPPWTLLYADGSANVYRFEATAAGIRFVYDPVTPERSSTGTYCGGDPIDTRLALDDARIAEVWRHATLLEADPAHHAADRCKGDGAITITSAGATRRFFVVRAATRTIEALLEALR